MATEGEHPKTDGDILYASEFNHVYNITGSPVYQSAAGSVVLLMSANASAIGGSLVFNNFSGASLVLVESTWGPTVGGAADDYSPYHQVASYSVGTLTGAYADSSNASQLGSGFRYTTWATVESTQEGITNVLTANAKKNEAAGSAAFHGFRVFGGTDGMAITGTL